MFLVFDLFYFLLNIHYLFPFLFTSVIICQFFINLIFHLLLHFFLSRSSETNLWMEKYAIKFRLTSFCLRFSISGPQSFIAIRRDFSFNVFTSISTEKVYLLFHLFRQYFFLQII